MERQGEASRLAVDHAGFEHVIETEDGVRFGLFRDARGEPWVAEHRGGRMLVRSVAEFAHAREEAARRARAQALCAFVPAWHGQRTARWARSIPAAATAALRRTLRHRVRRTV